jgi:uncharacterized protein (DUF2236 family)
VLSGPVAGVLARSLGAGRRPIADPTDNSGDAGWFGPDSVAWRVHADVAMLVAGMSAFLLQALHPRAMAGVSDHSAFGGDFLGRTRRTGQFVQGVVYGTSAEAERWCQMLDRVHASVVGTTPDGRPYSAREPELADWVHCTEYLAIASANRRFAANPMSRDDLDRYLAETARVGEATGVLDPPRSWDELDASIRRHRPNLAIGEQAANGVRFLENPPMIPPAARPAWRAVWWGAVACLPPIGRKLLRVREPSIVEVASCRAVVRALGRLVGPPAEWQRARDRCQN